MIRKTSEEGRFEEVRENVSRPFTIVELDDTIRGLEKEIARIRAMKEEAISLVEK